MRALSVAPSQRGMSLVETMWAVVIFAIVTLGVVPLIGSSLQASALSRSYTLGKLTAQEGMEQARGMVFFVSSPARKRDVLDYYYPCANPANAACSGFAAEDPTEAITGASYTTVCPSGSTAPECALNIPAGHTLTFKAQFVEPAGVDAQGREIYTVITPPSTYMWSSLGNDLPQSRLVRLFVTDAWTYGDRERSFELVTYLGDRKFGTERVRANAKVEYLVQATAAFQANNRLTNLIANGGSAESSIAIRLFATADQSAGGAFIKVATEATDTSASEELARVNGATSLYHAPPTTDPAPGTTALEANLNHPDLLLTENPIAFLDDTLTQNLRVSVVNDLPLAAGDFSSTKSGGADKFDVWLKNQANVGSESQLLLENNRIFSTRQLSGIVMNGHTDAFATALLPTADRRVEANATTGFGQARFFSALYIVAPAGLRAVVYIDLFSASATCKAVPGGPAAASASYSATLKYWAETNPNDGVQAGAYVTVPLGSLSTVNSDPLAAIGNPMTYEDPASAASYGSAKDIFLFPKTETHDDPVLGTVTHNHPGYLTNLASTPKSSLGSAAGKVAEGGVFTSAAIERAISITTVPSNPAIPQSAMDVGIGRLSCQAVDRR